MEKNRSLDSMDEYISLCPLGALASRFWLELVGVRTGFAPRNPPFTRYMRLTIWEQFPPLTPVNRHYILEDNCKYVLKPCVTPQRRHANMRENDVSAGAHERSELESLCLFYY